VRVSAVGRERGGVALVGDREEHGLEARTAGVELVELDLVVGAQARRSDSEVWSASVSRVVRPYSWTTRRMPARSPGTSGALAKLIVEGCPAAISVGVPDLTICPACMISSRSASVSASSR